MRIEPCEHIANAFKVHVDADELRCAARYLPYPTCIGIIYVDGRKRGRAEVWTPAASVPRGYKAAAVVTLEAAYVQLQKQARFGEG
jgi:hypothetical protein